MRGSYSLLTTLKILIYLPMRKKVYNYTVIFEREEDGGYHVFCPALPGCHTQGETYDDAMKHIEDAMKLYIESLRAHHEPVPEEDITIKPLKITV